jgi:acyl dehydratase
MPINLHAVGVVTSSEHDVSPRWALAYAACLGMTDPRHLDDSIPGGPFVVPTFCSCLEWGVTVATRSQLLGLTARERSTGVHATQSTEFLSPLKVGTKVRTTAQVVGMRRTSAGAHVQTRYEMVDTKTGELLTRSYSGSIFRGLDLGTDIVGELMVPATRQSHELTGRSHVAIDKGLPHVYSECAQIWNPIHTEQQVAKAAGLPGIILHGSATWALAGREIVATYASGDMGTLAGLGGRFKKPVFPGESIQIRMSGVHGGSVAFEVLTERGETAISDGVAILTGLGHV